MVHRKSVALARDIARQRSLILHSLAIQCVERGNIDRARSYIEEGLKILQKNRARKPAYYRRWICKKCRVPLVPGLTVRVRIRSTHSYLVIVKKCLICGWINRTAVSRK
ncbi:MAG: RNAse P, Rpr2/Rpp21 subunit [Sulfolobales archaeon]|nr:RNAse P, Rpr2/Rpp21 subunit [Sulfolobales archaeon]MDW8082388.1 RNAse P, Rpr2/Rpp21 subunit [Sulfolobales archaeon]